MKHNLVAKMICKNENSRYLERIIQMVLQHTNKFYVLDDGSTDDSFETYAKYPQLTILKSNNTWSNEGEIVLRKELFDIVMNDSKPEVLWSLDADDLYVGDLNKDIEELMSQEEYKYVSFPWFNMWNDEQHYILPESIAPRLFRTDAANEYLWGTQKYHVIPIPTNILSMQSKKSENTKIKHLGYVTPQERFDRINRKITVEDPEFKYFKKEHYEEYLDDGRKVVEWVD